MQFYENEDDYVKLYKAANSTKKIEPTKRKKEAIGEILRDPSS